MIPCKDCITLSVCVSQYISAREKLLKSYVYSHDVQQPLIEKCEILKNYLYKDKEDLITCCVEVTNFFNQKAHNDKYQ